MVVWATRHFSDSSILKANIRKRALTRASDPKGCSRKNAPPGGDCTHKPTTSPVHQPCMKYGYETTTKGPDFHTYLILSSPDFSFIITQFLL